MASQKITKQKTKKIISQSSKARIKKEEVPAAKPAVICQTCHVMPMGSAEVVGLLLVLVFSLTAVLITSVHALSLKNQEVDALKTYIIQS